MDKQRRDQIVLQHYAMVRRVARRMAARYPNSVEVDDLVSIGTMGLIDAAERFEESMAQSFSSYARIRVQGAIVDALRKLDWVPRSVRNRNRNLIEARRHLSERFERAPTRDELAAHLEVEVEVVDAMLRDATVLTMVSMNETRADSDQAIGDTLASDGPAPDAPSIQDAVRRTVLQAVGQLPDRDQRIVQMYYYEGHSFRDIGDALGVTESRISQLHTRIKRRLRDALSTVDLSTIAA